MKLEEVSQKRILLSVLNWGFGHTSRSIGIARRLLQNENELYIACDSSQKEIFKSYFSDTVRYIDHASYPFEFKGKGNFASDLFDSRRQLVKRFALEQKETEVYVDTLQIDLVISDHRYGFFSKKCPSVFITHQLSLPLKWFYQPIQWLHNSMIRNNYASIWVVDEPGCPLSGKLGNNQRLKSAEYIGHFSRFQPLEPVEKGAEIPYLAILSGPSVYAEHLLREVITFAKNNRVEVVCLSNDDFLHYELPSFVKIIKASDWNESDTMIRRAGTIISRTGYSTLMDTMILGKRAILMPTKGQTEQEYLGQLHKDSKQWKIVKSIADYRINE